MVSGLLEAINGSLNEELQLAVITNNLANVGVAGFKKDLLSFATLLRSRIGGTGAGASAGEIVQDQQLYRRTVKVGVDMSQGTLKHTGSVLDLAISGEGFFKIGTPRGIRYTRCGSFTVSEPGVIVTENGHFLLGRGGPISVSGTEVFVDREGRVSVDGSMVDTLDLVAFDRPERLEKDGDALFRQGAVPVTERMPGEETAVQQGYLEEANVTATEEMVKMLKTVRAYESYQKIIRALNDIDRKAINDLGRVK
jgi:flagellar basal-body rod protein FlgG